MAASVASFRCFNMMPSGRETLGGFDLSDRISQVCLQHYPNSYSQIECFQLKHGGCCKSSMNRNAAHPSPPCHCIQWIPKQLFMTRLSSAALPWHPKDLDERSSGRRSPEDIMFRPLLFSSRWILQDLSEFTL
jgi:hypothetical protein